jgi:proteinaceous RNase P
MLPAPKLFQRWKERHQVRFHMSAATGLELYFPPVFTTCIQAGRLSIDVESDGYLYERSP